ncbi:MAG: elongation factor Ts, partial [bacterium]|nr:elongation factor Ts [bacterium]
RNDEFRALAQEIAMQVASMNPEHIEGLLGQSYIRDQKITIGDMLKQSIAKFGENIVVKRFVRYSLDA